MSSSATLNAKQLSWAQKIMDTIKAMNLPADQGERATDIAFATVQVESRFQMYANANNPASLQIPHDAVGSDHGSVGLFQQQVGGAKNSTANWGTTAQCMDVGYSTRNFVQNLLKKRNGAWLTMSNGAAAQMVQGSAFPDRYEAQDAWAVELRKELWGGAAPAPAPTPAPAPAPAAGTYKVVAGDTLSAIATRFNYPGGYQALAAANGIANPNLIQVGQVLNVSHGAAPAPAPAHKTYTVVHGDTLSGIASRFNYPGGYAALAKFNGISNPNLIQIGQVIRLS